MTDLATLERWHAEAAQVLHQLRLGAQVVRVSTDRETVEYTPANADKLTAYIASLERRIAALKGRRGPAVSPYLFPTG